jgi:type IV pilus assembly protein PilA
MSRRVGPAGFTLLELLIVCAIIGILAAVCVPFLVTAKASGNEASAIGSLRAINSAESNYAATCASGAYAVNIPALVAQRYLSPDMGFNPKSGYNFALQAGAGARPGPMDCMGGATVSTYYASGRPVAIPQSGRRGFATNAGNTIWQDMTGMPPAEPFTAGPNTSPIQ